MIAIFGRLKNCLSVVPAVFIVLLVAITCLMACGTKKPPLSPESKAFKEEVGGIIRQMQASLAKLVVQGNTAAINTVLESLSHETAGMCIDCPYKTGVLNKDGILLTTFPNNEVVGRNFSSYKIVMEPLQKRRITQGGVFFPDGSKIYFIAAPLLYDKKVVGVVVLALTPADLEKKWHLHEKEFYAIDFNAP